MSLARTLARALVVLLAASGGQALEVVVRPGSGSTPAARSSYRATRSGSMFRAAPSVQLGRHGRSARGVQVSLPAPPSRSIPPICHAPPSPMPRNSFRKMRNTAPGSRCHRCRLPFHLLGPNDGTTASRRSRTKRWHCLLRRNPRGMQRQSVSRASPLEGPALETRRYRGRCAMATRWSTPSYRRSHDCARSV